VSKNRGSHMRIMGEITSDEGDETNSGNESSDS
jgi:hypothetical protein